MVRVAQKNNPTEVTMFSTKFLLFVIERYVYESIRTGLIKLLRSFLDLFEENKNKKKHNLNQSFIWCVFKFHIRELTIIFYMFLARNDPGIAD